MGDGHERRFGIFRNCPRCLLLLEHCLLSSFVAKNPPPCRHPGFDALALSLLLKNRPMALFLLKERSPLLSHPLLWPWPFFSSPEALLSFLIWADGEFENEWPLARHLTDNEMFSITLRRHRDIGIQKISDKKGFGVCAREPVASGALLGVYAGHIRPFFRPKGMRYDYVASLSSSTSWRRWTPYVAAKWVIDATQAGSFGRYVNHDHHRPALCQELFFWRAMPLLGLTTRRDVGKGEEITIDYGYSVYQENPQTL